MRTNRNTLFKLRRVTAAFMAVLVMLGTNATALTAENNESTGNDEQITETVASPESETKETEGEITSSAEDEGTETFDSTGNPAADIKGLKDSKETARVVHEPENEQEINSDLIENQSHETAEKIQDESDRVESITVDVEQKNNADSTDVESNSQIQTKLKAQKAAIVPLAKEENKSDSLLVHVTNCLNTNKKSVNGHAVVYDATVSVSKGGSKASKGFLNIATGNPTVVNGFGYTYKPLNAIVLTEQGEGPVFADTLDGLNTIDKIGFDSNGTVTIKFTDGTKQTLENTEELYISPVYKAIENWYLEYKYIDNISTGSGSWSNRDAVVEYQHTFSDPSVKTPQPDYKFIEWRNEEDGKVFKAGDSFIYSGAELKPGSTKTVNIYAYWQPAVTVNYHQPGKETESKKAFDEITVYDFKPAPEENLQFDGWYSDEELTQRIPENTVEKAHEITKEADTAKVIHVYARYVTSKTVTKVWDDTNNRDRIRPADVQVQLTKNGEASGEAVTLNAGNNWTYEFTNLTAYDKDGKLINYSADEVSEPRGYRKSVTSEEDTITITNSHTLNPTPAPDDDDDPDPTPVPTYIPVPTIVPTEPTPNPVVPPVVPQQGGNPVPAVVPANQPTPTPTASAAPTPSASPTPTPAVIEEPEVPLARPGAWALINLICSILTCITGLGMGITYLRKHDEAIDEGEEEIRRAYVGDDEEEEEVNKRKASKFTGIIPAVGSVILFCLTEDMRLPMRFVDKWTIWMVLILLVNLLMAYLTRNRNNEKLYFNANGGVGYMEPVIQEAGKDAEVPEGEFVRSGYTFAGWNTEPDGSGDFYQPSDSFRMEKDQVNKLYAQWRA